MKQDRNWPGRAPAAAMVSVMLDAEYIWLAMDAEEFNTPKHRSMGEYGPLRGVDKVLRSLKKYGVKATFFIPGIVAETYAPVVENIAREGHEIALHGYEHENFANVSAQEQTEILERGMAALEWITGKRPEGFRLPEGGAREDTLQAIADAGFSYDSSYFDHDLPYIVEGLDTSAARLAASPSDGPVPGGLVEIPMRWETVDFPYLAWGGSYPKGGSRIAIYDDVLDNWLWELEAARNGGYCFGITFTPQIIGAPGRMFMMDKILEKLTQKHFWIATGSEIANYTRRRAQP